MARWDGAWDPPAGRRNEEDKMRKLKLLLYAGTMAGALGGAAFAVEQPPSDGSTPTGPIQSPTGVGMVTTTSGFQEVGSTYTGGEGQQYTPGASSYNLSPFSTPAPGTAQIRIDLQTVMLGEGGWWTGMNGSGVGTTAVLNGATTAALGNKQAPYGITGYVRLDIAMDGMSKSGIRYGLFSEIRENTLNPNSAVGTAGASASGTGSGFANSSASSSGTSALNTQQTLYVRQAWIYFGTDTMGLIRVGQGFSANSLMQTGLNDEFDTGGWVGAQAGGILPGATGPTWPWADSGNEYQAARIAYLSPVIAGFDVVSSFAPNNAPATSGGDTCSTVYTGCVTQSSSNAAGDLGRYRNEFEIGLRYRNAFGPIGLAASAVYTVSGATNPGPFAPLGAVGTPAGPTNALRYNGLNMGMVGAEVTINKYLAIGANTLFGAYNGSWGLQSKAPYCLSATVCQGSETTAIAWVAGARFTIPSLPSTIGGSFFDYKYQGQPGLPTQRTSAGIDLGATYGLGPGAVIIAEYLWGYNYQGGYNFLTNASTGVTAGQNNKVWEQIALLGIGLRF
jgi:hypothetical protein